MVDTKQMDRIMEPDEIDAIWFSKEGYAWIDEPNAEEHYYIVPIK